MALLDDIRSHLAVANEDQRKRRGAVLLREAADEIERLRSQPCPYVTGTVTRYCTLTPFTLTDEEREAIDVACQDLRHAQEVAALRGLLERSQFAKRESDRPQPIATPSPLSTPAEGSVPTERT